MNGWIDTSKALPIDCEYVCFVVAGHTRSMMGVYENHFFCSHWGAYDQAKVTIWRKLGDAPLVPSPARAEPEEYDWSDRPMRDGF